MIKLFRIDERLIHGQIVIKWSKHTSVNRIVVANDMAAGSDIIQKSLKMAAPAEIKVAIRSIDDSVILLQDPRCENLSILLLVSSPADALKVLAHVDNIPFVNIGNYGRVAPEKQGMKRVRYANNLYCDDEEIAEFRHLLDTGIKCIYQTIPDEPPEDLSRLIPQ